MHLFSLSLIDIHLRIPLFSLLLQINPVQRLTKPKHPDHAETIKVKGISKALGSNSDEEVGLTVIISISSPVIFPYEFPMIKFVSDTRF